MFLYNAICSSYEAPMDIFGDHALLCFQDPTSDIFQLRHCLVRQSLGLLLWQACVIDMVETRHLCVSPDEGPEFGRRFALTRLAVILLLALWSSLLCIPGRHLLEGDLRYVASALANVEQVKRDKHMWTCISHHFDFMAFDFCVLGSFGLSSQELLDRVYKRSRIHARVAPRVVD